jgi:serine/threonine-protein kinase
MVEKFTHIDPADVEEPSIDPLIGKVLNGRFRITERLGAGGMGTVYKAIQDPLDRVVALKILNTHYGAGRDPGFQKRFFLEAAVTAKLRHPNTITVIDYGKAEDNLFYIAMEFVEGETLAQVIARHGTLHWPRALQIAMQICRSLREAHKAGVIHRDLKPANVMVRNEENDADLVKVLDFGLVKSFLPEKETVTDTELTQAGVFLGSPQYMAPEQAKNLADPRSDIYSLGVVLYQMLVGDPPFKGAQSIDVIVKHINQPPPPIRARRPELEIPPEVEALVFRCLEKDPARRYQSMEELLEGLRRAGSAAGLSGVFSTGASGVNSRLQATPPPHPRSAIESGPQTVALRPPALPMPESVPVSLDTQALPVLERRLLPLMLFGGALVGGTLIAVLVLSLGGETAPVGQTQAPAPPPPTATVSAPVEPAEETVQPAGATGPSSVPTTLETEPAVAVQPGPRSVRFLVTSVPSGAQVLINGEPVGETPARIEVPADETGHASTVLALSLDGYHPARVTAEGSGPDEVRVSHRMKKKKSPGRSAPANGYKDDPYQ